MIVELTPETYFESVTIEVPLHVVMHYGATCGPCKRTMPIYETVYSHFLEHKVTNVKFYRINNVHFYHFGSAATKNGKEGDKFKETEHPAAQTFYYKWGIPPQLFENNSHRPKNNLIKGIQF